MPDENPPPSKIGSSWPLELAKELGYAIQYIPCPSDTDGDGDCAYCSKPGNVHWILAPESEAGERL